MAGAEQDDRPDVAIEIPNHTEIEGKLKVPWASKMMEWTKPPRSADAPPFRRVCVGAPEMRSFDYPTTTLIVVLLYVATIIAGSLVNPYVEHLQPVVSGNWFESTLNHMLVSAYGYALFTLLYIGYTASADRWSGAAANRAYKAAIVRYVLLTFVSCALVMWFVGPLIFDRVNKLTGGYCPTASLLQYRCMWQGEWINGFDISGHTFMILVMSLSLYQVMKRPRHTDLEQQQSRAEPLKHDLLDVTSFTLLALWYTMLAITALFYHTFFEKVAGLCAALATLGAITFAAG